MKSSYLGAAAALACALGLSACGGGGGDMQLGGKVFGITKGDLVLLNNGGNETVIKSAGDYVFKDLIETDTTWRVTVKSEPSNVEKCEVVNAEGRAGFHFYDVNVYCKLKMHALGGTVTGLGDASGLVVVNGADRVAIPPGATTFSMAPVGEEVPYGIAILTQPAGRSCTLARGVATMGTADVTDVQISCVPAT